MPPRPASRCWSAATAPSSACLRPVQAARSLSTSGHSGITLYAPKELVISARAGTPLPEIEATLAEQGQHLIAEPPGPRRCCCNDAPTAPQTIGGIVATNLSGPRRVAWGAMRDHRARRPRGDRQRRGDALRRPRAEERHRARPVQAAGRQPRHAGGDHRGHPEGAARAGGHRHAGAARAGRRAGVAALSAGLGSPFGVSAAAWLPAEAAALVPGTGRRSAAPSRCCGSRILPPRSPIAPRSCATRWACQPAEILDDAAARAVWRAVRDARPLPAAPTDAVWRVSVRPSAGPGVLRAVADAGVAGFLDWGGGLVWLAGPANAATHAAVEAAAQAAQGTWTLLRAPEALRAAVQVVPPEPPPLAAITRRVKAALDPRGILNPGRLYAGL